MDVIKSGSVDEGLNRHGRVYLCGDLEFSNGVEHIRTSGYEIGISQYDEFTADKPHYHSYNTEYNYVLEGEIKVLLINEGREVHLKKGDLFVIQPNEHYVGKSLPGTRTFFSKVPGGNDKVEIAVTEETEKWSKSWSGE